MSYLRILTEDEALEMAENAATIALKKLLDSHGFKIVQSQEEGIKDEPHQNVQQIAMHTGMNPGTIRRMAREGTIPSSRAGRKLLFKKSEVDKALLIKKRKAK